MRAYLAIVAAFVGLSLAAGPFVDWPVRDALDFAVSYGAVSGACTVLAIVGGVIWHRLRGDRALPARAGYRVVWGRLRAGILAPDRWRGYAVVACSAPVAMAWYQAWRVWLNGHIPFTWDATLAHLGAALHGGVPLWARMRWMTATPARLHVTEVAYGVTWPFVAHGVVTWVAFAPASRWRTRYLVAFALALPLAGNVLAGLLMSAGPCYYARVAPAPNPLGPWSPGGATAVMQHELWAWYASGRGFPSPGVTAMPSMHVVMATLAACVFWARGWRLPAVLLVAFTVAASVALGWHYALDGYAAIVAALGLWWVAGRVARVSVR